MRLCELATTRMSRGHGLDRREGWADRWGFAPCLVWAAACSPVVFRWLSVWQVSPALAACPICPSCCSGFPAKLGSLMEGAGHRLTLAQLGSGTTDGPGWLVFCVRCWLSSSQRTRKLWAVCPGHSGTRVTFPRRMAEDHLMPDGKQKLVDCGFLPGGGLGPELLGPPGSPDVVGLRHQRCAAHLAGPALEEGLDSGFGQWPDDNGAAGQGSSLADDLQLQLEAQSAMVAHCGVSGRGCTFDDPELSCGEDCEPGEGPPFSPPPFPPLPLPLSLLFLSSPFPPSEVRARRC
jgi:hypothetical protein